MLRHSAGAPPPEAGSDAKAPPQKKLAIVACMDARILPGPHLGIRVGDAHIIRNAGGRLAEAVRSLALSQLLLGTEEVAIIHHTDCGLMSIDDDGVRERFSERGVDANGVAFLTFADLEESVREDLRLYRTSPLLRQDISVRGLVFDVATSRLREVTE